MLDGTVQPNDFKGDFCENWKNLIKRMIARDPNNRPSMADVSKWVKGLESEEKIDAPVEEMLENWQEKLEKFKKANIIPAVETKEEEKPKEEEEDRGCTS